MWSPPSSGTGLRFVYSIIPAKGTRVMKGAGLTKNFEVVGRTVYGETGNYTGAIRCDSAKTVAYFVVAGPASKDTEEIHAKLKTAFDKD